MLTVSYTTHMSFKSKENRLRQKRKAGL
ncbi:hypothetical protein [Escherichia coli]